MSSISSQHHSFDIRLAANYGMDGAVLIHHFQHWIRINRFAKRNIKEGRCWTYQTRKEIQAHFPYLSFDEVRRTCEKLVDKGVLVTGNFNKSKMDNTLWYAFVDEEAFGVDQENSNKFYERQNCPSRGKSAFPEGKSAIPIPDTKTDSKPTKIEERKEKKERGKPLEPPSADAEALCDFFLSKIKERNSEFKEPDKPKWIREFDCLLRIDKRNLERTKSLILWASEHTWWKKACLSPSKLRKDYDAMLMDFKVDEEKEVIRANRAFALRMKSENPAEMKNLTFDAKYAVNTAAAKEIPFNLPPETFKEALISMFGGEYVPG